MGFLKGEVVYTIQEMKANKILVTHHAPDLDAVGSVWLFQRFDSQEFASAKIFFVNPGETLDPSEVSEYDVAPHNIIHVDTGMGEFDHHQPERGGKMICASSLVFDHLCEKYPDLKTDSALQELVKFITEIDHFGEVHWPDAGHIRYNFMIHELIRGIEYTDPHNDLSQMHFGQQCLDSAYAVLTQFVKAQKILSEKGDEFAISNGTVLAISSRNSDTIKMAQKAGYTIVIKRDPKAGFINIKARPDAQLDLRPLYDSIRKLDPDATWFYHPSGKMLINGSNKHRNQQPSTLTLEKVVDLVKQHYS